MSIAVLADVVSCFNNRAYREEQPFFLGLYFLLHLGVNLPVVPALVGDLEDFAQNGRVNQADTHEN